MRVALLLAAIIVSAQAECTSNAFVCKLKEIGSAIKDTAINLGGQLATVGKAILGDLVSKGSELLLQGSKAIVGTLNNHIAGVGKREIQLPQQVLDIVEQGKTFLKTISEDLKGKFQTAISELINLSNKVVNLDFTDKLTDDVDNTVAVFKDKATAAFGLIKTGVENFLSRVLGHELTTSKRGISDLLSSAAGALQGALKSVTDALSPHVQTVIGQVTGLGQQVKDQAAALIDKLKQSMSDLSGKLSGHVSTLLDHGKVLVQHGKDALGAAKDAITQIAAQTLSNAKDTIINAAAVGKDAVGVIVNHVSNSGY